MNPFTELDKLVRRLNKIDIDIKCVGNFPWIYLHTVNGKRVTELYQGNHGFTIGFLPAKRDMPFKFTDLTEIFKIIRKYK